jgi:carboxypeptidase C (cathepsin A)
VSKIMTLTDHCPRLLALLAVALAVTGGPAALAQPAPATPFGETFVTHHTGVFGGQTVKYTATVKATILPDETGKPGVSFVTTDYVRDGVADPSHRPVIFGWAGGPSGPSSAYHMRILGPRQILDPPKGHEAEGPKLRDNPDGLLDIADVVLVDPAGTGFSRLLPGGNRAWFYSVGGDADSIVKFIDGWMKAHGRETAPRYVMGGSYGSVRDVRVAFEALKTHPVDGIIMTANSTMIREMSDIVGPPAGLPTLAMVAAYHGKADRRGRSDAQIADEAYRFAMHDYLPMLATIEDATPEARAAMAAKLQSMTGIQAADILANRLVISREMFAKGLLKAQGLVLNDPYDGRHTTSAAAPKAPPPSGGDQTTEMLLAYMTKELGVTYKAADYNITAPGSEKEWDFRGPNNTPRNDWPGMLRQIFAQNPRFRLYSANGYEDMTSELGQARFLFSRTPLPHDRVEVREYPGGHALYADPDTAHLITADIRRMITQP